MNIKEVINNLAEIFDGKSEAECNEILDGLNELIKLMERQPDYVKAALYTVLRQAVERVDESKSMN